MEILEDRFWHRGKVFPFGRTGEDWGTLDRGQPDPFRQEFEGTLLGKYFMLDPNILKP
jgi:hypothetical protein